MKGWSKYREGEGMKNNVENWRGGLKVMGRSVGGLKRKVQ